MVLFYLMLMVCTHVCANNIHALYPIEMFWCYLFASNYKLVAVCAVVCVCLCMCK